MRLRIDSGATFVLRWLLALAAAVPSAALTGCSAAQTPRSAPMAATTGASPPRPPAIAAAPVYRFVAIGGHPEHTVDQSDGSVAVVARGRTLVRPDGTVSSAPEAGMGGIQVPARLGGGYLFWAELQLGVAPTFLADPIPFAPLRTNVIDVMFGHDALLVFGPMEGRRAYALDPPRRVPLSPHGVVAIGGADDNRVLAVDAAGRARESTDGGVTWKDVTEKWIAQPQGVLGLPGEVAFELGKNEGAWLRPDGTFERRPLPGANRNPKIQASPGQQIYMGVLNGRRGSDGRVLLAEKNEIVDVDLATGAVSAERPIAAEGASCGLQFTAGDGLATCDTYSVHGRDALDVIGHALGPTPGVSVEKSFAHHPFRFAFGASSLAVVAPCAAGDRPEASPPGLGPRVVCVRSPTGTWTEYDAGSVVAAPWVVLGWIGREGGAPFAVVWEQGVRGREPRTGIVDIARGALVILDASVPAASNAGGRWSAAPDGSIRGFTPTGAIAIDPRGHVTQGARTFRAVMSAGDHAIARDDQWRLWQTTDDGATWVEVARPPVDTQTGYEPLASGPAFNLAGMKCGQLGCALDHPSGLGSWVRPGWPSDPPRASDTSNATSTTSATTDAGAPPQRSSTPSVPPAALPQPSPALAKLACTLHGELKPSTEAPLARIAAAHETARYIHFRDQFQGPDEGYTGPAPLHALRAVLRLEARPPASREPVDALYVETFDPAGRLRHATGFLGSASSAAYLQVSHPSASAQLDAYDESFMPARPVLGANLVGQAAGVIVPSKEGSLWVSPSGAIRRVASCGERKRVFGAVVDATGKLWVACGDYSRAVDVIDAETGHVQFALPAVLPWVWQPEAAFPLYGGGKATYLPNPDALARDASGKLGVLRIPSEAPATEDDPAWFLSPDVPPVELAPWSNVEPANSAACKAPDPEDSPVRALIQTAIPWVTVEGAPEFTPAPGMTAIVRWGRRRICVEAIEVGYEKVAIASAPRYGAQIMAVARFVGVDAGAGLVGMSVGEAFRVPATCKLEAATTSPSAP